MDKYPIQIHFIQKNYTNESERTFVSNKQDYVYPFVGFDIETTTTNNGSYMYAFSLTYEGHTYIGRTWDEVIDLFNELSYLYALNYKNRKLIIWVHNLSFEFQFLRKRIKFKSIFAKKKREIISATTHNNIEFRDSMAISGASLDLTSKLYGCRTSKMVGDLDYTIMRNSKTPLSDKEIEYIRNDTIILCEFAEKIYDMYISKGFLPITKTSILRKEVKDLSNNSKSIVQLVRKYYPTEQKYNFYMNWLFSGGITHANPRHTGIVLNGVTAMDIKSDYPFQMCTKYYPFGKPRTESHDIKHLIEIGKTRCVIMALTFTNIRLKPDKPISPISKSKCVYHDGFAADNGKLWKADSISIMATELDFGYIRETYNYDDVICTFAESYYRIKLPEYVLSPVIEGFIQKENLNKGTPEYMLAKQKPNSGYGMLVTRMNTSELTIDENGDIIMDADYVFNFKKEVRKAFLSPLWGIYVTSHARNTLMKMINKIGNDVVYCDTDSVYILNYDKHKHLFDKYNSNVIEFNSNQLPKECIKLGIFDNEGTFKFKTLGAKRYIKEHDGIIETTVSGMKKGSFVRYCESNKLDPFKEFKDGVFLSELVSEKTTSRYQDEYHEELITDDYGNSEIMFEYSSISVVDIPFSMSLERNYKQLIKYLKRGTKYENRVY